MAISIKHNFNCLIADDPASASAGKILPSHWNAALDTSMATGKIIGRKTASTGAMEELDLTDVLDLVGSAAQGDILYRGASTWTRLGAGTAKQFLQTGGAAANPAWGQDLPIALLTADASPDVAADYLASYDASASTAKKVLITDILKSFNGLSTDSTPDTTADFLLSYDASASAAKKVLMSTLLQKGGTLMTPIATTSGTSHNFTGIPTGTKEIDVILGGVSESGGSIPYVRIGTGSTPVNTSYVGNGSFVGASYGIVPATTGFIIPSQSGGFVIEGIMNLKLLHPANNIWIASGVFSLSGAGDFVSSSSGRIQLGGALGCVALECASAFDSGFVNVIYK